MEDLYITAGAFIGIAFSIFVLGLFLAVSDYRQDYGINDIETLKEAEDSDEILLIVERKFTIILYIIAIVLLFAGISIIKLI